MYEVAKPSSMPRPLLKQSLGTVLDLFCTCDWSTAAGSAALIGEDDRKRVQWVKSCRFAAARPSSLAHDQIIAYFSLHCGSAELSTRVLESQKADVCGLE